jgi:hypothetical protein
VEGGAEVQVGGEQQQQQRVIVDAVFCVSGLSAGRVSEEVQVVIGNSSSSSSA